MRASARQFFNSMEPVSLPLPSDAELLLCLGDQALQEEELQALVETADVGELIPILQTDATLEQLFSLVGEPDQLLAILPLARGQGCDLRQLAERIWTEWPREKRAQFFQILGQ